MTLDRNVAERELAAMLEQYAVLRNWLYFHAWRSDHSAPGFPDYVLVRDGRIIFSEIKRLGQKPTPRQREWLWELGKAAMLGRCEVFVWTIREWEQAERVLS